MPQASLTQSFTKLYRKEPYDQISPVRPELSADGQTVIVTGGHTGIGYAIAKSFAQAGASNVITIGRRQDMVAERKEELSAEFSKVRFHGFSADITDDRTIAHVFKKIRADIAEPTVLILCAAYIAPSAKDVDGEFSQIWRSFETNVNANVNLIREMVGQRPYKPGVSKVVIDVNSAAAHVPAPQTSAAYGASKLAIARLVETFQREIDIGSPKWPKDMRLYSMPPGGVFTEAAQRAGVRESDFPFDDQFLPGNFAVWLASQEAAFLRGKFVWCNWDAKELLERKDEIIRDDLFRLGPAGNAPYPVEMKLTGVMSETEQIDRQVEC